MGGSGMGGAGMMGTAATTGGPSIRSTFCETPQDPMGEGQREVEVEHPVGIIGPW